MVVDAIRAQAPAGMPNAVHSANGRTVEHSCAVVCAAYQV
jgi:hypothetical protein